MSRDTLLYPAQFPLTSIIIASDEECQEMEHDFTGELVALMPRMRAWALAMTHNRSAAEDLSQEVAAKALNARAQFTPGTNFPAWIRRIMVNTSISGLRARRDATDAVPEIVVQACGEHHVALKELDHAVENLPPDQREALLMVALEEVTYEDAADRTGCAVGTMKSRVHRARQLLRGHLTGDQALRIE
jgi:RNA polymerase sigma-70 factor (ECF subfamily)